MTGYVVRAEIPGVKKDDINVAIDGNQVEISAEVKERYEVAVHAVSQRQYRSAAPKWATEPAILAASTPQERQETKRQDQRWEVDE